MVGLVLVFISLLSGSLQVIINSLLDPFLVVWSVGTSLAIKSVIIEIQYNQYVPIVRKYITGMLD